ncbi:hypothetical protein BIV57_13265 [Mangrovactinospora gilvigrisea]|uniref:Uncharacterized protein n=1 Tax=Mangrovactinospora gilvigrisea TaxID=1428644 RepID=A0A1J7BEF8_9ACTN|nr:hypothetical protein [Mangrovactinospora gilvigrisea]OIV36957.1 hypothetical protein BIV57_13265 [Mangrovactinospora gilvigrisea]
MICHYLFMRVVVPGFFAVAILNARRQARRAQAHDPDASRSPDAARRHATLGCAGLGSLAGLLCILAGLITHLP